MAGDPSKASLWTDADVYIAPLGTANPATINDPFGSGWDLVGLLDGDAGMVYPREEEETDLYAWGGLIVRTSRRNFKQMVTFTCLEDTERTRSFIWPGSTATELYVPRVPRLKVGFEVREGAKSRRLITTNIGADVKVDGDFGDSEADLTRYPIRCTIFPDPQQVNADGAAKLFDRYETAATSS